MKIDLDDNGVGAFVAVMDLALKGSGISALGAVSAAMAILETAKLAEMGEKTATQPETEGDGGAEEIAAKKCLDEPDLIS